MANNVLARTSKRFVRSSTEAQSELTVCPCCRRPLTDDFSFTESETTRSIIKGSHIAVLSQTQWAIWKLVRACPEGIEKEAIFTRVYGLMEVLDNNVQVQMRHIRRKLEPLGIKIESFGWGGRYGRCGTYRLVRETL